MSHCDFNYACAKVHFFFAFAVNFIYLNYNRSVFKATETKKT